MSPAQAKTPHVATSAAPAVSRAAAILDLICASSTGVVSLSDISRDLAVPKSSTFNICTALEQAGLVRRDEAGYSLGRRVVELGASYLQRVDMVQEFYVLCRESAVLRAETVRVAVLNGPDVMFLARYEGHPAIRLTGNVGDKFPATAMAAGKVLLAAQSDADIVALLPQEPLPGLTPLSHTSLQAVLAELAAVRDAGFARDVEEAMTQVASVAVSVPTRGNRGSLLSLSVTCFASQFDGELEARLVAALRDVALKLGNPLQGGY